MANTLKIFFKVKNGVYNIKISLKLYFYFKLLYEKWYLVKARNVLENLRQNH